MQNEFAYRGRKVSAQEIEFIRQLIAAHPGLSRRRLSAKLCAAFRSLNAECEPTNTNVKKRKPYDHVMFQPAYTQGEIDQAFGF